MTKRVGIVGSGIMGSGIAEVAAKAGIEVVLRSRSQATADAMVAGLEKSLAKQVERGKLDDAERTAVLGRVTAVSDLGALADCDLVIESIVEDLPTKKHLFSELDRIVADGGILATNTSTLPVVEMAMETGRPELVCGIHFFNPAPMMPLVEVVRAITTSDETMATARAFAEACGKNPVEVRDQAGFIVNALLFPYLNNAVKLYDAGVATREDIDAAMQGGCNFPMGPLALLDLVGLDTSLAILEALYAEFKDPNYAPAPLLRRMVSAERYGRKSKLGFYDYRSSGRDTWRSHEQPPARPSRSEERARRAATERATLGSTAPRCERRGRHDRSSVDDAHVLGPLVGPGVQRAVPLEPGEGSDRPVGGLRPAHPDGLRPRPRAGTGRGRQGRRAGAPPR